jgi:hypothetical protein
MNIESESDAEALANETRRFGTHNNFFHIRNISSKSISSKTEDVDPEDILETKVKSVTWKPSDGLALEIPEDNDFRKKEYDFDENFFGKIENQNSRKLILSDIPEDIEESKDQEYNAKSIIETKTK